MPHMPEKLKKGELSFRSEEKMLAQKLCDKREVWMLSTFHKADMKITGKIDRDTGRPKIKLTCII